MGRRLVIVGHGIVQRQVLGPESADGVPAQLVVQLRRYRCRACKAILMVGPRGLVRRRWYGAGAIAAALTLYASGATSGSTRARVSPVQVVGVSAVERWATLVRWIEAARSGALFGVGGLEQLGRRSVADQVVHALAARGGWQFGDDLAGRAFDGASIAA
ncbi:MAG TPA: hypothetical protein VJT73_20615 [Polyangiaceae bacterium]|nr:hypothetical protein [Polyangiaceae bacterium]